MSPTPCGASFMAGTICSLPVGHAGAHAPICLDCGKDWHMQECICWPYCKDCGIMMKDPTTPYCDDCCCDGQESDTGHWCQLENEHPGACEFADFKWPRRDDPPSKEELAEVYRSLGIASPMQ